MFINALNATRYTNDARIFMIPTYTNRPNWLKSRGYTHITPKLDIGIKYNELYQKVTDEKYVAKHGFYPLIHSVIKDRKFKKIPFSPKLRSHSYLENGEIVKTAKLRPLHYSTHIDALIFGYYAELLQNKYEEELNKTEGLSECVTAYRKIEINELSEKDDKNQGKSTIHFAYEAFEEIKKRATNECIVLMFDIKSFFSEINHAKLKEAWCKLINVERLNAAHFNVFKAATDFRYILMDDLRLKSSNNNRKAGFDEAKLANIRKRIGTDAFFESNEELKNSLKNKEINVYKHPFVKNKRIVGIPQGLPISAVLANLYLLEFDKEIVKKIVKGFNGYYRRYSDDILIICNPAEREEVESFVLSEIKKWQLEISTNKTETYLFKIQKISYRKSRITSIQLINTPSLSSKERFSKCLIGKPLTYLGFEFYGYKTLIKSSNLAKFYRRMIYQIKKRVSRARKISLIKNEEKLYLFRKKLERSYRIRKLEKQKEYTKRKKWGKNSDGTFSYKMVLIPKKRNSNYLTYIERASEIMNDKSIIKQLKKRKEIFNSAINKHLNTD